MNNYNVIHISPGDICYQCKDGIVPLLRDGDWDLKKNPFQPSAAMICLSTMNRIDIRNSTRGYREHVLASDSTAFQTDTLPAINRLSSLP